MTNFAMFCYNFSSSKSHEITRVYFARDYIFFKGPNNVIGLYWRLKFEWEHFCVEITQPSDFALIYVLFSNLFGLGIFKLSFHIQTHQILKNWREHRPNTLFGPLQI